MTRNAIDKILVIVQSAQCEVNASMNRGIDFASDVTADDGLSWDSGDGDGLDF